MFMDQETCSCEEGSTLLWMSGLLCPALGTGAAPPSQLTGQERRDPQSSQGCLASIWWAFAWVLERTASPQGGSDVALMPERRQSEHRFQHWAVVSCDLALSFTCVTLGMPVTLSVFFCKMGIRVSSLQDCQGNQERRLMQSTQHSLFFNNSGFLFFLRFYIFI